MLWEALEKVMETRGRFLASKMNKGFILERAEDYDSAIHDMSDALSNYIRFIERTVLCISRPSVGYLDQLVV